MDYYAGKMADLPEAREGYFDSRVYPATMRATIQKEILLSVPHRRGGRRYRQVPPVSTEG